MKSEDFDKCRQFLEKSISEAPDNGELLKAYVRLVELKSEYDKDTDKAWIEKEIREAEYNFQYHSAVHTNNTKHNMAWNQQQAENYRNDQNQWHGTVQSGMQHGCIPRQP